MSSQQPSDDPAPGDVVDAVVETVTARLAELQPYLDEAERLQAILAASGHGVDDAAAPQQPDGPTAAGPRAGRAATGRTSTRRPARNADTTPKGSSKAAIMALIAEQPGVTAADIARASGMKRTVVASTISRLKRTGELEPEGRGVRLPR